ncbi:carbohydrate ABC transporter, N-acetylglucosamine/diacetylchitobiose-binding protein [Streptomyces albus subsp. chlorinus]|uniref:N-acetylglucosamine/diacetylchitobiose ABC transporter substrate-binding protein n=1 Tax=Streptomyces albus TaxID=1888 RepID=UPI00156F374E|nr:N-acetylglucosamine/diacetylchitobiose ABC transporter substrate-binding protein [Streptomyces albus]NSC24441.1 carbohydrate ABC transporter, N-acetylglucosamine/diacetylchitobiose-binding protein [Streptomyces albus subsp. chlorinus]
MGTNSVNRRAVVKRAGAASLLAVPGIGSLASCATGGSEDNKAEKGEKSAGNPLSVKKDAALQVYVFNGGYDDKYARYVSDMYEKKYPEAEVDQKKTEKIATQTQPRIVKGDPPDVINNSGADNMNISALVKNEQVADVTELLDAPSWDDPDVKVRDILVPGVVEMGQFGTDAVHQLNVAQTVYGIWYSDTMLRETLEAEYPRTWDEMLALCKKAKKKGLHGWTYPAGHPRYMFFSMYAMFGQAGGRKQLEAMDYLEPNAWKSDAVKAVFEAYEELRAKKYVLQGFDGEKAHIEAQTAWTKGKAVFIPDGSWVENEAKPTTPKNFEMRVGATPSLDKGDAMPFGTLYAPPGEPFLIPEKATNRQGGLEWMRMMYSKKAARNFFREVSSMPVVKGAIDGLDLPPGVASSQKAIKTAGDNVVIAFFKEWYTELWNEDFNSVIGKFMNGETSVKEAMDTMQKAADRVAKDLDIQKIKKS